MAVTVAQKNSGSNSANTAQFNTSLATQPTAGNLLIAWMAARGGTANVWSTIPTGWTQLDRIDNGSNLDLIVFTKTATGSEGASGVPYNFAVSSGQKGVWAIAEIAGADATTPVNAHNTASNASSTAYTGPSVTPSLNGCLLLAAFGIGTGTSGTPNAAWTEQIDIAQGAGGASTQATLEIQSLTQATAAAVNGTVTWANAAVGSSQIIALAPAPTGTAATRDTAARLRLVAAGLRDTIARFHLQSLTIYRDVAVRFALVPQIVYRNTGTRFGLIAEQGSRLGQMALGQAGLMWGAVVTTATTVYRHTSDRFLLRASAVRDAATRFRVQSPTAYRHTVARLALRSASTLRDTSARYRLAAQQWRLTGTRLALRSAARLRDTGARSRLLAAGIRDTAARLRLASPAAYRLTSARFRAAILVLRDTGARFALIAAVSYRATSVRLLVRATVVRDAAGRLALRSAATYRDAATRARLAILAARDTAGLARLASPATYRLTAQRLRLAALVLRDTAARLRLVSPATLRDAAARFRVSVPGLYRDAAARARLVSGLTRDGATRFRLAILSYRLTAARLALRSAPALRDLAARARLRALVVRDAAARLRLASPASDRDLSARFRQGSALLYRATSARLRLSALLARDTTTRLALVTSGVFRDTGARALLRATTYRDLAARVRFGTGPFLRDTAGRLRLVGPGLRDAAGRFGLRLGQASRPVSDTTVGNWTTDAGAATGLYARINEVSPDFTSYIQSPSNPAGEATTIHCGPLNDPGINTGYRVGIGYQVDTVGAVMNVQMDLIAGGITFATRTFASIPSNQTLDAVVLTSAEVDAMRANGGFAGFDVRFTATQTG